MTLGIMSLSKCHGGASDFLGGLNFSDFRPFDFWEEKGCYDLGVLLVSLFLLIPHKSRFAFKIPFHFTHFPTSFILLLRAWDGVETMTFFFLLLSGQSIPLE